MPVVNPLYVPRSELFEHYVLAVQLPAQYTLSGLLKIPNQMQSKKVVTYGEWVSVSATLGVTESIASAIFEAFTTYHMTREEKTGYVRDELSWKQSGQRSMWLRNRKVPLHQFLLFAFCQQYKVTTPTGTAWQAQPLPAELVRSKQADPEKVMKFVTQHLYHLLALIAPKYKVNYEQIQALGLLLAEVRDTTSQHELNSLELTSLPFGDMMPFWVQDKSAAVDIHAVSQYINEHLKPPSRLGYCIFEMPSNRAAGASVQTSPGDVVWPAPGHPQKRDGVIRGVVRAMVYRNSPVHGKVENAQIYDCHHANLYVLGGFRNVTIMGCSHSTIVLGPVGGCVTVLGCSRVNIVVPCRGITLQNVTDSRIYTCSNTQPLVFTGVERVDMAPYNTHYPALEQHLVEQGVNPLHNLWNSALPMQHTHTVGLLPVEHFTSITIPFTNHPGTTHSNPCVMPSDYMTELKRKVAMATNHCSLLMQSGQSSNAARLEMAKKLADGFKTWLQTTGNLRHVVELLHYQEDGA